MSLSKIEVEVVVHKPLEHVWACWTSPKHIVNWNFASDDWHCPHAVNDLKVGGLFSYTMAAKDGSMSFDFAGVYDTVIEKEKISYDIGGRKVDLKFTVVDNGVKMTEIFDPEDINPADMQRAGWQAILDNFKRYAESQ
jgi:uncharacterized protein YndB with AHSA1/START domain